jgi:hypothetical protein
MLEMCFSTTPWVTELAHERPVAAVVRDQLSVSRSRAARESGGVSVSAGFSGSVSADTELRVSRGRLWFLLRRCAASRVAARTAWVRVPRRSDVWAPMII